MKASAMLRKIIVILLICLTMFPALSAADSTTTLTLQDSIDMALKQSVIIHSAREGVAGAEAQKREALTGFLPTLSTSYNYTRYNTSPYTTIFDFPNPGSKAVFIVGTQDNYTWSLRATQPIFAGGGILANYQANSLALEAVRMDEHGVVLDIIQDVKFAYINVIKVEKLLDVARQSLKQLESHYFIAQNFFEAGMIPRNDLLQSGVQVSNGKRYLLQAENGLEVMRSRFNTLLRRDIDSPVKVEDIFAFKAFEKSLAECQKTALENRPEIKAHSLRVEQAKKGVSFARSEYFPTVNVVGNYARFGDTPGVSGSDFQNQENWSVSAVANWTFWEWGRTKSRVDLSQSRKNQASDALVNVKDQITLEVKNAYLFLREMENQIVVTRKAVEQAEENFRINEESYKERVATSTDVLDAQTLLTKAKSDYTTALGDYHISYARLERAMGTGLDNWIQRRGIY
jgi:outer membrane protein TolC